MGNRTFDGTLTGVTAIRVSNQITENLAETFICFDRDTGQCFKIGTRKEVLQWHDDAIESMLASGGINSTAAERLSDGFVLFGGHIPQEEVDRCRQIKGYSERLYEKVRKGEFRLSQ